MSFELFTIQFWDWKDFFPEDSSDYMWGIFVVNFANIRTALNRSLFRISFTQGSGWEIDLLWIHIVRRNQK